MYARTRVAIAALSLSAFGLAFLQQHEGTREQAYLDSVGVPTICTGSTRAVRLGQVAAPGECETRLREDTSVAGNALRACVKAPLTQEQYDAVLSLTFNVGGGAVCRSTLVRKLNAGDCLGAANEFPRWNRAGGRVLPGLSKRRAAERELFIKGCN